MDRARGKSASGGGGGGDKGGAGASRNKVMQHPSPSAKNKATGSGGARQSKVNRILNNIERSLMRPFSMSSSNIHEQSTSATRAVASLSPKRNNESGGADCSSEMRDGCDSGKHNAKSNRMTAKGAVNGGIKTAHSENRGGPSGELQQSLNNREQQQKVPKDQVANSAEFYLHQQGRNRRNDTAAAIVDNSVDFGGHVNGKLESHPISASHGKGPAPSVPPKTSSHTFNKFQQHLVSTLRHHNAHSQSNNNTKVLPTINKLSIPPPHANEEARSHNQSMLFGRGVADAVTSLSINQQQQNESPAKRNSATSRLSASSSSNARNTQQQQQQQQPQVSFTKPVSHNPNNSSGLRASSSPASSAKSLPSIVTRLGSQLNGGLKKKSSRNADSESISKKDDEESGFSNYQSRRPPLRSAVNSQSTINNNNNNATQHSEATTLSTATNTTASNMMPTHQSYWQSPNRVTSYNPANQQPFSYHQQYPAINSQLFHNSHPFVSIKQVPSVPSLARKNLDSVQYNLQQQQQHEQQHARVNYLNSIRQHHPFPNTEQQSIYGVHNVPIQPVKQTYMSAGSTDNSQQIYANAPPKPRRYQFYGNVIENTNYSPQLARTTTAPGLMCANRSGAPMMQHPHQPIRPFEQVPAGIRSGNCDQLSLSSMPSSLKVSDIDHNRFINVSTFDCRPMSYGNHLSPSLYYERNAMQQPEQQHFGVMPLSKSKSSLESADLMKFRQNRFMGSTHIARPQAWHHLQQQQGNLFAGPSANYQNHDVASLSGITPNPSSNGVNLQRSKSVTHLLPDFEYQQAQINGRAREMWQDSRQVANNLRYLSTSSASTTNLTNMADMSCYSNNNVQYVLNSDRNNLNKALSSYHLNDLNQFYDSNHASQLQQKYQQIYPGGLFPNATIRRAATNDWLLKQQQHLMKQNEINFTNATPTRNDDKAVPSSSSSSSNNNSGMFVRQQPQLQTPITEGITPRDDASKSSLDDKIRHLVIVNDNRDSAGAARLTNQNVGVNCSSKFNQVIQCSSNNSITSGCQTSRQALMTKGHNTNLQRHDFPSNVGQCALVDSISHLGSQQIDKASSDTSSVYNSVKATGLQASLNEALQSPATNDNSINSLVMGNRHNRQYQVNVPAKAPRADYSANSEGANSQLIVDLTTPRVLAKTQTTLSSNQSNYTSTNSTVGNENRPINQVGLPQSSITTQPPIDDNSLPSSKSGLNSNSRVVADRSKETSASRTNVLERTAPYYYSDLKSDEQRQALFNIVQQKSLSPPPQLLSRSADQSSTRLGPKSATLHSKQAKLLSENLNYKQRPCIQTQPDFSSNTSITKNIDRLFDGSNKNDNMARSMLTLANNSSQLSQQKLQKTPSPQQMTKVSPDKKPSKSKSLDNLNQASDQTASKTSNDVPNPVYENIRLSSKLMNAISSSGGQPVTSDESMDSILSSSLEDSDSNSDIIDDIKLSPTDNHINDISRLIEQLKINHSKLTDEYRATLIRITKTINSKNKQPNSSGQKVDSDRIARKLDLLKSKSKKCESRSKNQLALIQMMENVLRQSKMRAENVNKYQSGSWSNESTTTDKSSAAFSIDALNDSLSADKKDKKGVISSALSKTNEADKSSKNQDNKKSQHTDGSSEVCKIGSFDVLRKDKLVTSSVAEKILDIEKRTRELPGGSPTEEKPAADKTTSKSSIRDNADAGSPSNSSNPNNSLNSITNGFQTMRDDDDFIEFYSSDISGHRSNFEASQFSASDYNTSTSASESSTSGLCTDSLGSTKNMNNFHSTNKKREMRSDNCYPDSKSDGESKLRSHNNLSSLHDKNVHRNASSTNGRHSADLDSIRSGKFTNVLGNVIDVDVCPVNNLSRCSPMEN